MNERKTSPRKAAFFPDQAEWLDARRLDKKILTYIRK
jgi:hypothetical protein